jgi:transposase
MRKYPEGFFKIDFVSLYKAEKDGDIKIRYLAFSKLQEGDSITKVAGILLVSRQSISTWINWLREEGMKRISKRAEGQGRKSKISDKQKNKLKQKIIKQQEERKGGRLIGKNVAKMIFEEYNIEYHPRYVYEILHKMGLSWVSSRSRHPKQDKLAQEAFKKTSKA